MAVSVRLPVLRLRWLAPALILVGAGLAVAFGWRTLQAGVLELNAAAMLQPHFQQQGVQSDGIACLGQPLSDPAARAEVQRAVEQLNRAVQLAPNRAYPYFRLGRAHCLLGNYAAALDTLPQFTERRLANPQSDLELGFALEKMCPPAGECPTYTAVKAWQRADVRPEHFVGRGEAARQAQQYPQAIEWYQRAQRMGADLRSTILYVQYLQALADGQDQAAFTALRDATSIDSGWADAGIRFLGWYRYGRWLYEVVRDYSRAEEIFLFTITLFPGNDSLRLVLGEVYRHLGLTQFQQGTRDLALLNIIQALEVNPKNHWAHFDYGRVLYIVDNANLSQTETEFEVAINLAINDPQIWGNVIRVWGEFGYPEKVLYYCDAAHQQGIEIAQFPLCSPDK